MSFKLKQNLFYFLSILTLITQVSLSYCVFHTMHKGQEGLFLAWITPIFISLSIFILLLFIGIIISGNKNIGPGEWFLTFSKFSSLKKVYHSELGYFVLYLDDPTSLYKQDIFRLTHLKDFTLDPERIHKRIKEYLDDKFREKLSLQEKKEFLKSEILKVKKWDGFLDTQGKRDEKINQLLK